MRNAITKTQMDATLQLNMLECRKATKSNKCTHRNKLADVNVIEQASTVKLNYCLSNSFAFGGNNASLILGTHNE